MGWVGGGGGGAAAVRERVGSNGTRVKRQMMGRNLAKFINYKNFQCLISGVNNHHTTEGVISKIYDHSTYNSCTCTAVDEVQSIIFMLFQSTELFRQIKIYADCVAVGRFACESRNSTAVDKSERVNGYGRSPTRQINSSRACNNNGAPK